MCTWNFEKPYELPPGVEMHSAAFGFLGALYYYRIVRKCMGRVHRTHKSDRMAPSWYMDFPSPDKLTKWAGITPRVYQSADKLRTG